MVSLVNLQFQDNTLLNRYGCVAEALATLKISFVKEIILFKVGSKIKPWNSDAS